jgi:putative isomerase
LLVAEGFRREADELKTAINKWCWDERDGFYYSVDVNLEPEKPQTWYHSGRHRHWPGLLMRIGVWSGFLGLWAEAATPEQAERVVEEHYRNDETFRCEGGIRTLSKMEKMYTVRGSGNPSCWLGPVWGVSNYLTWHGLVKYGFEGDARELAERTIRMFGRDVENCGAMHEYYQPSNAEPILNPGFQNWNHLVLNMIAWFEDRETVTEF